MSTLRGWLGGAAILLAMAAGCGNDGEPPPESDQAKQPAALYDLSARQRRLIEEFGYPDSFVILFFQQPVEDKEVPVRAETWFYYGPRTSFVFTNGQFTASAKIDGYPPGTEYPGYRPEWFARQMSWEQAKAVLGERKYTKLRSGDLKLKTELPEQVELVGSEMIAMGFAEDRLVYVQTVPLLAVEAEEEESK